jgi:chromosome partitioning protein
MVLDGAPHATADTLRIARVANLVIIPTGTALDDLEPSVRLAHELRKVGVDPKRMVRQYRKFRVWVGLLIPFRPWLV